MIETKDVFDVLKGFYPTASTLTTAITSEIANGCNAADLDYAEFVRVVERFRMQDSKAHWAPTLRQLRPYFPAAKAIAHVRPDHERRWVIWPARLAFAPQYDEFIWLWRQARYIEAFDLLLSVPGLEEGERLDAEANRKWGEAMRRAGDRSAEHYAKYRARQEAKHPDTITLAELVSNALPPTISHLNRQGEHICATPQVSS